MQGEFSQGGRRHTRAAARGRGGLAALIYAVLLSGCGDGQSAIAPTQGSGAASGAAPTLTSDQPVSYQDTISTMGVPFPFKDGRPLPIRESGQVLWVDGLWGRLWSPSTGQIGDRFRLPFAPDAALESTDGIILISNAAAAMITPQGKIYTARLLVKRRAQTAVLTSTDEVVIVGGFTDSDAGEPTSATERVSFDGERLTVDRTADIPGPVRTGFSAVALAQGQVMVLGGNEATDTGCSRCSSATYILDANGGGWHSGPALTEARAGASATLLPDGSVLVAGGWTAGPGGASTASRSVERWIPPRKSFKQATTLPVAVALQEAFWLPQREGGQLVLAGGTTPVILAYDVEHGSWNVAGETCLGNADESGRRLAIPAIEGDQFHLYVKNGDRCQNHRAWADVPLRLAGEGEDVKTGFGAFPPDEGTALYRTDIAFVPGQGDTPALALGGAVRSDSYSYASTAAADAISADGHLIPLPAFNQARTGAQAFRLPGDALLVAGGRPDSGQVDAAENDGNGGHALPAELLPGHVPASKKHWTALDGAWANGAALGQLPDGSLVAVDAQGKVSNVRIALGAHGKPSVQVKPLPAVNRLVPPLSEDFAAPREQVKGLADGRIVVTGGVVELQRIALLQEDSWKAGAPDTYVGTGEFARPESFAIYDPKARTWRESAKWPQAGGPAVTAVFDDGRVVRFADGVAHVSSADGASWSELSAKEPPIITVDAATRLFVTQNELFLAGVIDHSGGTKALQWFDFAAHRWKTLWQTPPGSNWEDQVGRVIVRRLDSGKRVVLPVHGM